jgi:hypothetical protein
MDFAFECRKECRFGFPPLASCTGTSATGVFGEQPFLNQVIDDSFKTNQAHEKRQTVPPDLMRVRAAVTLPHRTQRIGSPYIHEKSVIDVAMRQRKSGRTRRRLTLLTPGTISKGIQLPAIRPLLRLRVRKQWIATFQAANRRFYPRARIQSSGDEFPVC